MMVQPAIPADRAPALPAERLWWRRAPLLATLACVSAIAAALPAHAVVVERVRMHEAPEHTRVVFETSGSVNYAVFRMTGPNRVVVDLKNAALTDGLDPRAAAKGHKRITNVRTAPRGAGQRVVLDMAGVFEPRHFKLDPVPPYGHRLVVDLFEQDRVDPRPAPAPPQAGETRRDRCRRCRPRR